ncbi:MAG: VPLPA-CTERM sorting domain-containing protein [Gammaproteobacteria bacterium]|nr:VPLPA-CTERM sorting domain-containing protein [Gammaproteobacteria bacterium]
MYNKLALAISLALSGQAAFAAGNTLFDDVAPNTAANVPIPVGSPLEATNPLILPSATWTQTTIAERDANGVAGHFWDMIDTNRTGVDANRYLFMPFEPSNSDIVAMGECGGGTSNCASGALRIDTWTGETTTIVAIGTENWQRGDASRWAPWGGWITGEENWSPGSTATTPTGRLFEVTNPVTTDGSDVDFVQRNNVIPRVSHEGLAFDADSAFYFVDENSSGSIYKFVSANPLADNGDDYFNAGTTYALKMSGIGDAFDWVALDPFNLDGRGAADAVGADGFNRPEDLEIKTLGDGSQLLFFAATGTHDVWTINLGTNEVYQFVSQATIDLATGLAVGSAFRSPDNLAIDADGNIYIIEDQETPNADIWLTIDENNDGIAEGIQRWAGMQVTGAEPTGLFFDLANPNVAYVNIQHPDSLNDRTVRIEASPVPVPAAVWLFGSALAGFAGIRRRKA